MNDSQLRITGWHLKEPGEEVPELSDADKARLENRPESQWHAPLWHGMSCSRCGNPWPCQEGLAQARECDG